MAADFDDRYEDINYANDIYDSGPAEWITESGAYLDALDADAPDVDCEDDCECHECWSGSTYALDYDDIRNDFADEYEDDDPEYDEEFWD